MDHILHRLSILPLYNMDQGNVDDLPTSSSVIDILGHHPFRPKDVSFAPVKDGTVYVLCSTKDTRVLYIGETSTLHQRLRQHNEGHGALATRNLNLRPWGLFLYVSGFGTDAAATQERKKFEGALKHRIFPLLHSSLRIPTEVALEQTQYLLTLPYWKGKGLVIVKAGSVDTSVHSGFDSTQANMQE